LHLVGCCGGVRPLDGRGIAEVRLDPGEHDSLVADVPRMRRGSDATRSSAAVDASTTSSGQAHGHNTVGIDSRTRANPVAAPSL
jgi:hypothetical protein